MRTKSEHSFHIHGVEPPRRQNSPGRRHAQRRSYCPYLPNHRVQTAIPVTFPRRGVYRPEASERTRFPFGGLPAESGASLTCNNENRWSIPPGAIRGISGNPAGPAGGAGKASPGRGPDL